MNFEVHTFRERYRAAISPGYNPWLHAGFVAVVQVALLGADQPADHGVDAHLGRPFHGQRAGQAEHGGLGCAISGGAGRRTQRADAANEDDHATALLLLHGGVFSLALLWVYKRHRNWSLLGLLRGKKRLPHVAAGGL